MDYAYLCDSSETNELACVLTAALHMNADHFMIFANGSPKISCGIRGSAEMALPKPRVIRSPEAISTGSCTVTGNPSLKSTNSDNVRRTTWCRIYIGNAACWSPLKALGLWFVALCCRAMPRIPRGMPRLPPALARLHLAASLPCCTSTIKYWRRASKAEMADTNSGYARQMPLIATTVGNDSSTLTVLFEALHSGLKREVK